MDKFIDAARAKLGAPFRHQGRGPTHYDCGGLVVVAGREAGYRILDRADYPADPNGELYDRLNWNADIVPFRQPGDLLEMRFGREPQHVAIWTGSSVIHTNARCGMVVEHSLDKKWENRVVRTWRLREHNQWQF